MFQAGAPCLHTAARPNQTGASARNNQLLSPPGGLPPSSQPPPPAMSSCLPPLSRFFFLRPKRLAAPPPPPAVPVPKTYVYSSPGGVDLRVDLYAPSAPITPSPVIIFFHGGQLLYGARDFVIAALRDDTLARNWTFLSYDYRKLSPASAHDILKDLHAAFTHYHTVLAPEHGLSATNVFVAGYSAGGYLAQLAGVHWEPKPLALLLVAPMGGRLLGGHYYGVKAEGEDGEEYKEYLPPHAEGKELVGALAQTEDEEEWRRREKVAAQLCKRGVLLDVLTGVPGLSAQLREFAAEAGGAEGMEEDIAAEQKSAKPKSTGGCRSARTSDDSSRGSTNTTSETTTSPTTPTTPTSSNRLKSESFPKAPKKHPSHCPLLPPIAESSPSSLIQGLTHIIPQASRSLFPELLIDESFPPCYIVHGTADTTVLPAESAALEARLRRKQVPCELVMVEGASHQAMGLEGIYRDYIQGVMEFFGSRILPDEDEEEGLEEEEF